MKRSALFVVTVLAAVAIAPRESKALIVECENCSSLYEQLAEYAEQAKQYGTQLLQYQNELMQYANMVQNTVGLPFQAFAMVQSDLSQVRALANAASVLTGNSGSILTRLSSASMYGNQVANMPAQLQAQYTMWQQTLGNASNSLGRVLGQQQSQMLSYTTLQQQAQLSSMSATGQVQAIQAGNQLAALTATQMNQLQATLTSVGQEMATRDITLADRQANEDAMSQHISTFQNTPTTGAQAF